MSLSANDCLSANVYNLKTCVCISDCDCIPSCNTDIHDYNFEFCKSKNTDLEERIRQYDYEYERCCDYGFVLNPNNDDYRYYDDEDKEDEVSRVKITSDQRKIDAKEKEVIELFNALYPDCDEKIVVRLINMVKNKAHDNYMREVFFDDLFLCNIYDKWIDEIMRGFEKIKMDLI